MKTIYTSGIALAAALGMLSTGSALAPAAHAAEVDGPKVKWDVSLWGKKRAFTAGVEKLSADGGDSVPFIQLKRGDS